MCGAHIASGLFVAINGSLLEASSLVLIEQYCCCKCDLQTHFIPTSEHQQPLTASRIHLKIPRKCNHMHNQNKHPSLEHTPKITTTHCLFTFPLTSTSTCAHKEQIRKKSTTTEQEKKSKKRKTPKKTNKTQSYITTTLLQSLRVPQSRPQ